MNSHKRITASVHRLLCCAGLLWFIQVLPIPIPAQPPQPRLQVDDRELSPELKRQWSYAPGVRRAAPSVVFIATRRTVAVESPFMDDPILRRFFGDRFPTEPRPPQEREGLGSGVIVSEDGFILTNNHVIDGADRITVTLAGTREEFEATVVGTDPPTDVAVLKIEATGLPAITLGDSDLLEVGDTVLAIGNPFRVGQTVTMGIVSGIGRRGVRIVDYADFIQTDAPINPGNSGGALVDVAGRLVGINTAILSRTGASLGIGFAIPINQARQVMDQLIRQGQVVRGFLGITLQDLTPDMARGFRLSPETRGALVAQVVPGSPADQAGLRSGDVIVGLDGSAVEDDQHLRLMVAQIRPGSRAALHVLRRAPSERIEDFRLEERTVPLVIGTRPGDEELARMEPERLPVPREPDLFEGTEVAELNARFRQQFGIPPDIEGVLVTRVASGSRAYRAGLRPGAVIREINHRAIQSVPDAVRLARQADPAEVVVLLVWHAETGTRFMSIPPARG